MADDAGDPDDAKGAAERYAAWIAQLPEHVRAVAQRFPNYDALRRQAICYRHTDNPAWHFTIGSYSTSPTVTLTLVHGRDSTMPGVAVFGQLPEWLLPCGCGQWLPPTDSQRRFTERRIAAFTKRGKS